MGGFKPFIETNKMSFVKLKDLVESVTLVFGPVVTLFLRIEMIIVYMALPQNQINLQNIVVLLVMDQPQLDCHYIQQEPS